MAPGGKLAQEGASVPGVKGAVVHVWYFLDPSSGKHTTTMGPISSFDLPFNGSWGAHEYH